MERKREGNKGRKEIQFWKEGALEVIRLPAEFPRRELFEMSVELRSSSIYDGWWNIRDAPVIRRINSRRALSTSAASAIAIKAHRWKPIRSHALTLRLTRNVPIPLCRSFPVLNFLFSSPLSPFLDSVEDWRSGEDFQFCFPPAN